MHSYSSIFLEHQGKVTDKWSTYLDFYDSISRNFEPKKILEIGVQNGGSLEVWGKVYPDSELIIGVDVDENCRRLSFSQSNISIVIGDIALAATKDEIEIKTRDFDLIIDDGSHKSSDIIHALITYLPLLNPGGKYIIEDLHASYWQSWEGGLFNGKSALNFLKRIIDIINVEHWDERVTVAEYLSKFHEISDSFLESLKKIKRIGFENSICLIEMYCMENEKSSVGVRSVTGTEEIVAPGTLSQRGLDVSGFMEKIEKVQNDVEFYLDPDSIGLLSKRIYDLEAERDAIFQSKSWRITEPLRRLPGLFR